MILRDSGSQGGCAMIGADEAVKLINELICAEVVTMKQIQTRGQTTKAADKRELQAVKALFSALTGREPISSELTEALNV